MFLKIFIAFSFLISSCFAANLPQAASIISPSGIGTLNTSTSGGSGLNGTITVPASSVSSAGAVTIGDANGSLTAGNYYGLYSNSSGQFQTTAALGGVGNFYLTDVWYKVTNASPTPPHLQLFYSTGAIASEGTASAPTGVVYILSASSTVTTSAIVSATNNDQWIHYSFSPVMIPVNSYIGWRSDIAFGHQVIVSGIVQ